MDPTNGGPTDALTAEAIKLISALGSSATTVSQVIDNKDEAVYSAIQKGIDAANEHAVSHAQKVVYEYILVSILSFIFIVMQVQKFIILRNDFSIIGGELGIMISYVIWYCY